MASNNSDYSKFNRLSTTQSTAKSWDIIKATGQLFTSYGEKMWDDGETPVLYCATGTVIDVIQIKSKQYIFVLTAAHNVIRFIIDETVKAKGIWFYPTGHDPHQKAEAVLSAFHWEIFDLYDEEKRASDHDMAILVFKDKNKYFSLNGPLRFDKSKIELKDKKKDLHSGYIYGYPDESVNKLKGTNGKIQYKKDKRGERWIYDEVYTLSGQEGAAIFEQSSDGKYKIVGIHTFCNLVNQRNRGVKLDQTKIDFINEVVSRVYTAKKSNFLKIPPRKQIAPTNQQPEEKQEYKQEYKQSDKWSMDQAFITNPVIINIGISIYDKENCLNECEKDISTMNKLWNAYGYGCIYDNKNPHFTEEEFWDMMESAKDQFTNKSMNHDAFIISFSGHGDKENIWCSDYTGNGDNGKVNISEMQKFVSFPNIRGERLRYCPRIAII
eukprot:148205_1